MCEYYKYIESNYFKENELLMTNVKDKNLYINEIINAFLNLKKVYKEFESLNIQNSNEILNLNKKIKEQKNEYENNSNITNIDKFELEEYRVPQHTHTHTFIYIYTYV